MKKILLHKFWKSNHMYGNYLWLIIYYVIFIIARLLMGIFKTPIASTFTWEAFSIFFTTQDETAILIFRQAGTKVRSDQQLTQTASPGRINTDRLGSSRIMKTKHNSGHKWAKLIKTRDVSPCRAAPLGLVSCTSIPDPAASNSSIMDPDKESLFQALGQWGRSESRQWGRSANTVWPRALNRLRWRKNLGHLCHWICICPPKW